MIKQKFGDRLDEWIHIAFPFLFVRPLKPNLLTLIGAIGSLFAGAALAMGWFATGGVLILVSGFFDLVDGVVARHNRVSTRFGSFLDSTLDRFADMVVLVGMATHFAVAGKPGLVLLTGVALMSGVMVSYSMACAKIIVPSMENVGFFERGERVGILAAGAILGFPVFALWILAIGSSATAIQRFLRAFHEMEQLDAAEQATVSAAEQATVSAARAGDSVAREAHGERSSLAERSQLGEPN